MSGTTGCAKHCEHLSHTLTVHPPVNVYVCCHCGAKREERVPTTGGSWTYRPDDHGPFAPNITPYFGGPRVE